MERKSFWQWVFNNGVTANLISGAFVAIITWYIWSLLQKFMGGIVNETIATAISAVIAAIVVVVCCWSVHKAYLYRQSRVELKKDKFWSCVQSEEFKRFTVEVMKRYYGEEFFVSVNGISIPVFVVPGISLPKVRSISDFNILCDRTSNITGFKIADHQGYKTCRYYREYSYVLDGKILYPDRPGYMLDQVHLNGEGVVDKFSAHVGTFAENVYSCHVLEYELYQAYLQYEKALRRGTVESYWQNVMPRMEIRNKIHADVDGMRKGEFQKKMARSLLSGCGRHSLLSVQMLVVVRAKSSGTYEVKIAQRSSKVVISPNIYQFIPAGGFEILNDSDDDQYDDKELSENFSPGCAVFREFLEELFDVPEFNGNGSGSVVDRVLNDPRIRKINCMLNDGTAEMQFLGSVMDLRGLRHELSFVLVIHDPDYSEIQFLGNEECKKGRVVSIPISKFDDEKAIWNNLHGPSAAMWGLFKQTKLYEAIRAMETVQ